MFRRFALALSFLTIFPVRFRKIDPQELNKSVVFFPLVGFILGITLAALWRALSLKLPDILVSLLLIIAQAMMTGAIHLDGFIDTVDGLYGGNSKQKILEIMRDSRVGSLGAVAVFLLLSLKLFSLNAIPDSQKMIGLALVPTLSRWCMVLALSFYGSARGEEGLGEVFIQKAGLATLWKASLLPAFLAVYLMGITGILFLGLIFLTALGILRYIYNKIGGMTGDTIGAVGEATETLGFLYFVFIYIRG